MSTPRNVVLLRGEARFDMVGRFLGYPLKETDEQISQGLAQRLVAYARKRAQGAGLWKAIKDWDIEVYTMDGDATPPERDYNVKWTNPDGTSIELCRIMTRNGWPFLDHQFSMTEG